MIAYRVSLVCAEEHEYTMSTAFEYEQTLARLEGGLSLKNLKSPELAGKCSIESDQMP